MRSPALALLLLALLLSLAHANEPPVEERVFVETTSARSTYFVGEPIVLRLRIGLDRAFFEASAVRLFRREMDLPVQVEASWLKAPPTGLAPATRPRADDEVGEGLTLALGDQVAKLARAEDEVRDGRRFTVLELERRYRCDGPQEVRIPGPSLRFAYATRFEEDFVGGRVAVDRRDVRVAGSDLALRVLALPEAGRPPEFVDAVGRFDVRAALGPAEGDGDRVLHLRLEIEGDGNLASLTPPPPERIVGFHVYGTIDRLAGDRRIVQYDVAPLDDGVGAIPALAFAFFDPGPPAGYHVARTTPIALAAPPTEVPVDPPAGRAAPEEGGGGFPTAPVVVVLIVVLSVALRRRRRATEPVPTVDPRRERAAQATSRMREAIAEPEADLAQAFTGFLAGHLDCSEAAVIGADLRSRLAAAGVPADLAQRTASMLERLVAARYGGESAPDEKAALATLIEDIVDDLDAPE